MSTILKEKTWEYYGRNLENYKSQHEKTAREKDVLVEFMAARTLTQARKILFGSKQKRYTCCTGGCYQCNGRR